MWLSYASYCLSACSIGSRGSKVLCLLCKSTLGLWSVSINSFICLLSFISDMSSFIFVTCWDFLLVVFLHYNILSNFAYSWQFSLNTVILFAIFLLCHVPLQNNFCWPLSCSPLVFFTTDSRLLKDVWGFCFEIFLLPSKN